MVPMKDTSIFGTELISRTITDFIILELSATEIANFFILL